MLDIKGLHYQRGSIKGSLTRFSNYLDQIDWEKADINIIKVKLEKIEPLWDKFENIQTEIELSDPENEKELKEREVFEEEYFVVISRARTLINNRSISTELKANSNSNSTNLKENDLDEARGKGVIKLPELELPTFDGKWEEFHSFKEEFQSLIDCRKDLVSVQKFRYLIKALKGDAAMVGKAMEVTSESYQQAWEALEVRFDNKRWVVNRHVKAILDCEKIDKAECQLNWDGLLVPVILRKLDTSTVQKWEQIGNKDKIPTTGELMSFLQDRAVLLGAMEEEKGIRIPAGDKPKPRFGNSRNLHVRTPEKNTTSANFACYYCQKPHKLFSCSLFRALAVPARINEIKRLGLCENCFLKGHSSENCTGLKCRLCTGAHNTLLHRNVKDKGVKENINKEDKPSPNSCISVSGNALAYDPKSIKPVILLSTAIVHIIDKNEKTLEARVLLDSGSQSNFITERFAKLLNLPRCEKGVSVSGIGGAITSPLNSVECTIKSRYSKYKKKMEFLVLPKITLPLPELKVNTSYWDIPQEIFLADPKFDKPGHIDALIGAEHFFNLLKSQQIALGDNLPKLQHTELGWVIVGKISKPLPASSSEQNMVCCGCSLIEENLRRFWEIEEVTDRPMLSVEEKMCENLFNETTRRDIAGKFIVKLPTKGNIEDLGESEDMALKRFYQLERRLERDKALKKEYTAFIREYLNLGHMKLDNSEANKDRLEYYMPHHCVINRLSSTTRLRVVFDASAKSSSGRSLNDLLMVGPKMQDDLFSIILRFRQHKYVITADITKMYRQIWIAKEQLSLQKILWRDEPSQPIQKYCLRTVTYGTASASYLATRCLKQTVIEEGVYHPDGVEAALSDFYMDDLLTGADRVEELSKVQMAVTEMLKKAHFELHKWCANDQSFLKMIPEEKREKKYIPEQETNAVKTLGLWWNPTQDCFSFSINLLDRERITKRSVLSEVARIFDPLGLVGPVIVKAKLFLQQLWISKTDWDEDLVKNLQEEWIKYRSELKDLETLKIERPFRSTWNGELELHGFSDASEKAYGAVIYVKDKSGEVKLLCAKSRVAPLKCLSLPRLELFSLILARLIVKVLAALRVKFGKRILWCDSTILLAWLNSPPGRWKTFVANRVCEIQEMTAGFEWRHVKTEDNPADKISRGLYPSQIVDDVLWWHGPPWLSKREAWPMQPTIGSTTTEERRVTNLVSAAMQPVIDWDRFSSYTRLVRTVVYIFRFIKLSQRVINTTGAISGSEWSQAEVAITKLVQSECFGEDLNYLRKEQIFPKSRIKNLCPFIDKAGIIRVGGRLSKATAIPYDQRYPYLLPDKHRITKLIAEWEHLRHLHAGPQLLLAAVPQKYWPLRGRDLVRKVVHNCVKCFRSTPKLAKQQMGNLPTARLHTKRAFLHTGIDYCGPLFIKAGSQRNAKLKKAYVAVFICMTVKAVHLGWGAERELKRMFAQVSKDEDILSYLAQEAISWEFIPPYAPHFGGLWESAVKSFKFHFKRIVGQACLTYEEMITYTCLIESCLNSRPLYPLTSDPNDLYPLTPGHFLIGDALTAIPQVSLMDSKTTTLTRWHRITQMLQHFWARWAKEYLSSLQTRSKWVKKECNLQVGQLVLLKEEQFPPLKWPLGQITAVHQGSEGLVRVVTIKTVAGTFKRPVCKVCPLPTVAVDNSDIVAENPISSSMS